MKAVFSLGKTAFLFSDYITQKREIVDSLIPNCFPMV